MLVWPIELTLNSLRRWDRCLKIQDLLKAAKHKIQKPSTCSTTWANLLCDKLWVWWKQSQNKQQQSQNLLLIKQMRALLLITTFFNLKQMFLLCSKLIKVVNFTQNLLQIAKITNIRFFAAFPKHHQRTSVFFKHYWKTFEDSLRFLKINWRLRNFKYSTFVKFSKIFGRPRSLCSTNNCLYKCKLTILEYLP